MRAQTDLGPDRLPKLDWSGIATERAENRIRRILDAASDAFVSTDAEGSIVDWSREAELIFGWTAIETIGKPLRGTVMRPREEDPRGGLASFMSTGEGPVQHRRIEMLVQHREGHRFPVEVSISPMVEAGCLTFNVFFRDIADRKRMERQLEQSQLEVLERLAVAAEYHNTETGEHMRRVGQLAALIAESYGLDEATVGLIGRAAPLHDVGKVGVPDSLLAKPGPLTALEFELVKKHTTIGAAIISGHGFDLLEVAENIAFAHHESWDGNGYPCQLAGDAIPLVARIAAVADVFDALTHHRPYKQAWSRERAIAEIRRQSGAHFDPSVVDAFLLVQVGVHPVARARAAVGATLSAGPKAPAEARELVRGLTLDSATRGKVELIVSELVANSVRHGGTEPAGDVTVTLESDPAFVRGEISDDGVGFDWVRNDPELNEPGGLGLLIVDRLSKRWGTRRDRAFCVWFEYARPA